MVRASGGGSEAASGAGVELALQCLPMLIINIRSGYPVSR